MNSFYLPLVKIQFLDEILFFYSIKIKKNSTNYILRYNKLQKGCILIKQIVNKK